MKHLLKTLALGFVLTVSNLATAQTTDIVDTAIAAGQFKTLVAAVQAAGLVSTLKGPGPFTVFAPTDAAFAKLPNGTVEALLNNIPALTKILTYHVVAGDLTSAELSQETCLTTLQGESLQLRVKNGHLFVNNSEVIVADVQATNGVIHVIDTVLLPK